MESTPTAVQESREGGTRTPTEDATDYNVGMIRWGKKYRRRGQLRGKLEMSCQHNRQNGQKKGFSLDIKVKEVLKSVFGPWAPRILSF
jgi:hypothetical protein